MKKLAIILCASLLILWVARLSSPSDTSCTSLLLPYEEPIVVVRKSAQLLCARIDSQTFATRVSLGRVSGRKQFEGDHKTPEGTYWLSPARPSQSFAYFMHISYPSKSERDFAQKLRKKAGGAIGIHGPAKWYAWLGSAQSWINHSDGCIVLDSDSLDQLRKLVKKKVPIVIKP